VVGGVLAVVAIVVAAVLLAGGDDDDATTHAGTGTDAGTGTGDTSLALGVEAPVGDDYVVAVTGVDPDATQRILDENDFNVPPPDGSTYVLVSVRATYVGDDAGSPYLDLSVGTVTDDGVERIDADCTEVTPDDMFSMPDLEPGATSEGNFCLTVPIDQVPSMTMFVETVDGEGADRSWWRAS
jgi:hypothetical protein